MSVSTMTCQIQSKLSAVRLACRVTAAALLIACAATNSRAQNGVCGPACDFDAQMFSPVDYDFDCLPLRKDCGVFFNFRRLAWAYTGEKTTIGDPGRTVQSEQIYRGGLFSEGVAPPTYTVQNGIQEALPDGDFGYGSRYELGYFQDGAGWMVGVMDGPRVNSTEVFGFNQIDIPNTLPLVTQAGLNGDQLGLDIIAGLGPILVDPIQVTQQLNGAGSADLSTSRTGFGSVHVNFETPAGYLLGFRDYHLNGIDGAGDATIQSTTVGGTSRQLVITAELTPMLNNGGQIVLLQVGTANTSVGGDGIPDNLDGDAGGTFFFVTADIDGDGTIDDDEVIGTGVDFDDLHMFNIKFDDLTVRNTTESNSIEIMRFHELDNNWMFKKRQNNSFQLGYGVRFFRLDDNFYWEGRGGVLGRTVVNTEAENQIVGPQIRASWQHRQNRWGLDLDGRFVFGYNVQDIRQDSNIGEDLQPGALNRPASAQSTTSSVARQDNNFSPLVELRAEGSYQLTSALALKLGYTAMFIDNITRGSQVVRYRLPDMGIRRGGNQEIFASGVDVGVEAVY